MNELLDEELGGGGENPFGAGKELTPPPRPHNITYFCGTAQGTSSTRSTRAPGAWPARSTAFTASAPGMTGHQAIKENQAVFNDFLPHLNSVPPAPAVELSVNRAPATTPAHCTS